MTEDVQAELVELNGRIDSIDDPREGYALVKETIRRHEAAGDDIPDDLQRLEKAMEVECLCASQGR
ncbi:MAG: hypothetical protein AAFV69_16010 [Pseudomonadota bacterium]